MDSESDAVRRYLAQRTDFIGALRLPDKAFMKTAGTQVVTDVIVLQKKSPSRVKGLKKLGEANWLASVKREDLGKAWNPETRQEEWMYTNEYFVTHPEMILGARRCARVTVSK